MPLDFCRKVCMMSASRTVQTGMISGPLKFPPGREVQSVSCKPIAGFRNSTTGGDIGDVLTRVTPEAALADLGLRVVRVVSCSAEV